jgi:hypothetical protein
MINHPYIYSIISHIFPKLAKWAKNGGEDKLEYLKAKQIEKKLILNNLMAVNSKIEEEASSLGENVPGKLFPHHHIVHVLHKILPHLPVRVYHELCKDHADIIDHELVMKIIWIYRKLFLFLEIYFKPIQHTYYGRTSINFEYKENYPDIFFPSEIETKLEINDNFYSQATIVYSLKIAAVKMHEFEINFLDEYLKLLDKVITYCK